MCERGTATGRLTGFRAAAMVRRVRGGRTCSRFAFPRHRPGRLLARPARRALVRPRLFRRHPARLALLPPARRERAAVGRPAGAADPHRHRRFPALDDRRHRRRRPPRQRALLRSRLLSRRSARRLPRLGGRHVLPRRADRRHHRRDDLRLAAKHPDAVRCSTSSPRPRRSGSSSAASPTSSTASSMAVPPTCPGRWCFRPAVRSRAIRASSTRRRSKASCSSWRCGSSPIARCR